MGTNVLYSIHRSIAANYIRGYTTEPVITEQSEKSITLSRAGTGSQPTKTFYNSAILIYTQQAGSTSIHAFLFGETAFDCYSQYSSNGTSWTTASNTSYNTKTGDCYSSARYTEYTVDSYTWASNYNWSVGDRGVTYEVLTEGLPIFTDPHEYMSYITNPYAPAIPSNGGGATHIAKVTGQLSSLSNNLSDILMVSGGGGGGLIIGEDVYAGKDAGGVSGSGDNSANQTTGYAFGQGESADGVSGGGGGLYGGYKGGTS